MNRLFSLILSVLISVVVVGAGSRVSAEEKSAPEISTSLKSMDELLKDLEFILGLTEAKSQKQWPNIKSFIDFFLTDIDTAQPIRVDLLLGEGALYYRTAIPVPIVKNFLTNTLEPVGVDTKRQAGDDTLYRCENAFPGYMRYVHKYAIFGEKLQHVAQGLADPTKSIAGLVKRFDLGLKLTNPAAGEAERRTWFEDTRKELLANIRKKDGETSDDFALRKLVYEQQLEEFGRFYAEASEATLGWSTDTEKKEGRFEFELAAKAGTSLAKTLDALGETPSHFVNVPTSEGSILSLRVNHPLDAMRRKNIQAFFNLMKSRAEKSIDADTVRDDAQKAKSKTIVGLLTDLFNQNAEAGVMDVFVDVRQNESGKKTALGGFRCEDETKMVELLKLLPDSKAKRSVELDADKEGAVSIHQLKIVAKDHELLSYFIVDDVVYVGTSKNTVWFAAGENALSELKGAITQAAASAEGKDASEFVQFSINLRPWLEQRDARRADGGDPALRKQALTALKTGEDALTFEMKRVDKKVSGTFAIQQGVLRLAGEQMAAFSEENLPQE